MASPSPVRWRVPVRLGDRRVLRRGRWRWLRALGWLLLLFFLTAAAFGLPLQWVVDLLPLGNGLGALIGPLVGSAAALGSYVLCVRLGEGRWPGELALRPALPGLAVGAVLGLAMMAVLMGAMVVAGLYDITLIGAAPLWSGLGLALQVAVTEELWMRALLLRLLWRALGPIPAFAGAALVFGALHLANPGATALAGATVTAAGLMFCALYALTGRLWVPVGLHLAWNFAQGSLFGAVVSGNGSGDSLAISTARPGAAAWLTGGTFGPEGSVFALLLVGAATVGALWMARAYAGTTDGTTGSPQDSDDRRVLARGSSSLGTAASRRELRRAVGTRAFLGRVPVLLAPDLEGTSPIPDPVRTLSKPGRSLVEVLTPRPGAGHGFGPFPRTRTPCSASDAQLRVQSRADGPNRRKASEGEHRVNRLVARAARKE